MTQNASQQMDTMLALGRYAEDMTKANWQSVVNCMAEPAYLLAYTALGDKRLACKVLRKAFREIYMKSGWTAQTLENGLYQAVLRYAGQMAGMPFLGEEAVAPLYSPEGSEDFIPRSFNDDPAIRAQLLAAAEENSANVRLAAAMRYRLGLSVERIAEILGCSAETVQNRINTLNASVSRAVDAIREETGARSYSPESVWEMFHRAPVQMPMDLIRALLRATIGSPLLSGMQVIQRALNLRSVSGAQSVQSSVMGALAGSAAIGGVLIAGNLMIVGAMAVAMYATNLENNIDQYVAPPAQQASGGSIVDEQRALKDSGFAPKQLSAIPSLPVVPPRTPVVMKPSTPEPTPTQSEETNRVSAKTPPLVLKPSFSLEIILTTPTPSAPPTPTPNPDIVGGEERTDDFEDWTEEEIREYWENIKFLFGELGGQLNSYFDWLARFDAERNGGYTEYASLVDEAQQAIGDISSYLSGNSDSVKSSFGQYLNNGAWQEIENIVKRGETGDSGYVEWDESDWNLSYANLVRDTKNNVVPEPDPGP